MKKGSFHRLDKRVFNFSYPFSEEYDEARSYLRVRCPAWCDRIFLSHSFKNMVYNEVIFLDQLYN